jgi:hypothetical protein
MRPLERGDSSYGRATQATTFEIVRLRAPRLALDLTLRSRRWPVGDPEHPDAVHEPSGRSS